MPHKKSLHNYLGVNLSASTKLSWQKKPEQINNPEQSAPRRAVWSGLSDCFLHHSRSAGRFNFRSHTLKELFSSNIYLGQTTLLHLWIQSSWFLMKLSGQDPHFSSPEALGELIL